MMERKIVPEGGPRRPIESLGDELTTKLKPAEDGGWVQGPDVETGASPRRVRRARRPLPPERP